MACNTVLRSRPTNSFKNTHSAGICWAFIVCQVLREVMIMLQATCLIGWTKPMRSLHSWILLSSKSIIFLSYLIDTINAMPRKLNVLSPLTTSPAEICFSSCMSWVGKMWHYLLGCSRQKPGIILGSSLRLSSSPKQFACSVRAIDLPLFEPASLFPSLTVTPLIQFLIYI